MAPKERADSLEQALATMRFRVRGERYLLVGAPRARADAVLRAAASMAGASAVGSIVLEPESVTWFAPFSDAQGISKIEGARSDGPYRVITFETPMGWDVVGFLALATRALAEAGVPLGAICSFDRDHLFVRETYLDAARAALRGRVCEEVTDPAGLSGSKEEVDR